MEITVSYENVIVYMYFVGKNTLSIAGMLGSRKRMPGVKSCPFICQKHNFSPVKQFQIELSFSYL